MMLLTCDVECYRNYFLIMFYSIKHDKYTYIEVFNGSDYDKAKLKKLNAYTEIALLVLNLDAAKIDTWQGYVSSCKEMLAKWRDSDRKRFKKVIDKTEKDGNAENG